MIAAKRLWRSLCKSQRQLSCSVAMQQRNEAAQALLVSYFANASWH